MSTPITITLEFTPNPNTLKFVVNHRFLERGAVDFPNKEKAVQSPLAGKLFEVPGIQGLLIGINFITITKSPEGDWDVVADQVPKTVEAYIQTGAPIFAAGFDPMASTGTKSTTAEGQEVEKKVREILDNEIRPAVAMDGGDITFGKYEDGVVYLHLQGACSSCPSSIATLKMGVETRLKEVIPEIREVVQI